MLFSARPRGRRRRYSKGSKNKDANLSMQMQPACSECVAVSEAARAYLCCSPARASLSNCTRPSLGHKAVCDLHIVAHSLHKSLHLHAKVTAQGKAAGLLIRNLYRCPERARLGSKAIQTWTVTLAYCLLASRRRSSAFLPQTATICASSGHTRAASTCGGARRAERARRYIKGECAGRAHARCKACKLQPLKSEDVRLRSGWGCSKPFASVDN
eukprot:6205538-Pleurochrysis_carterae.AAC.3